MNKTDLVSEVVKYTGLTKKDTEATINAAIEVIQKKLKEGGKVQLIGFGAFEVKDRKAREGRNPRQPGELVKIPSSKAPVFKAGKAFKDYINK